MSRIKSPKIDKRRLDDLLNTLKQMAPHYTPQWQGITGNDSGFALLKIFSYITGQVISRLNQVPGKNLAAFLDMLGIRLLSAQPARVPLTFKLAPGTEKEVLIPARTQAAAGAGDEHDELPYETEENLLAIPAQLVKVISVVPDMDAIYLPPPGFLEGTLRKKASPDYTIISTVPESLTEVEEDTNLPPQKVKYFQLDHVTGLKKGDILKIGSGTAVEYAIIAGISGTIVTLTERL
ncbi:MAG: hypothetical protein KAT34_22030, partial [Candidatus Aminicenantes bacterium]|nr:hypothetical protein [Candidatus Aminicenantes bacterium]